MVLINILLLVSLLSLAGCGDGEQKPTVVVYTAHDQIYSEPIFRQFEEKAGIAIKPVFDTEATKTVGLANRILSESSNPQCDVFWNNEIVRSLLMKRKGLLASFDPATARDIPALLKDPDHYWTGFAARARVLIVNTNLVRLNEAPTSLLDLAQPRWKAKVALAQPLFGTTATHAAALFVSWGDRKAADYFRALKTNGIVILDGNASVKDAVVRGEVPLGLTDTDDAYLAMQQGKPVQMVFLDQGPGQLGTLILPNTVVLIKGAPHSESARSFIEYLLSREAEQMLAFSGSGQMPVRSGIPAPAGMRSLDSIKSMPVDWEKVADKTDEVAKFMSELFVR